MQSIDLLSEFTINNFLSKTEISNNKVNPQAIIDINDILQNEYEKIKIFFTNELQKFNNANNYDLNFNDINQAYFIVGNTNFLSVFTNLSEKNLKFRILGTEFFPFLFQNYSEQLIVNRFEYLSFLSSILYILDKLISNSFEFQTIRILKSCDKMPILAFSKLPELKEICFLIFDAIFEKFDNHKIRCDIIDIASKFIISCNKEIKIFLKLCKEEDKLWESSGKVGEKDDLIFEKAKKVLKESFNKNKNLLSSTVFYFVFIVHCKNLHDHFSWKTTDVNNFTKEIYNACIEQKKLLSSTQEQPPMTTGPIELVIE